MAMAGPASLDFDFESVLLVCAIHAELFWHENSLLANVLLCISFPKFDDTDRDSFNIFKCEIYVLFFSCYGSGLESIGTRVRCLNSSFDGFIE